MAKTATQHRQDASDAELRKSESIERSDTDGFLSQWANGITADLARARAKVADNDGKAEFRGLFTEDGTRVEAKIIINRWNQSSWMLTRKAEAEHGRRFIPACKSRGTSRIQKALKLHEEQEMANALAVTTGSGTGLAGACSVHVTVVRTDRGCPGGREMDWK